MKYYTYHRHHHRTTTWCGADGRKCGFRVRSTFARSTHDAKQQQNQHQHQGGNKYYSTFTIEFTLGADVDYYTITGACVCACPRKIDFYLPLVSQRYPTLSCRWFRGIFMRLRRAQNWSGFASQQTRYYLTCYKIIPITLLFLLIFFSLLNSSFSFSDFQLLSPRA